MTIYASGQKLLHEATGIRRGRIYPVSKNKNSKIRRAREPRQ